ncbi:unnamed protein product [Lepeophtheirus salmonis]|uniref:(salmon louse) hypothetical protein n=1 Tax=Lepeophtheirus salmonis TaxID=72036 RepID=A0A7R8GZK9_LEPSM|nr:unnamed protein product [Lepeophtheirus salmonis]CAF2766121.1 unnamed protein product [Lepeophtheirus salmonis]
MSSDKEKLHLLEDSSWLRKIVTQYQKRQNCGVTSFNGFTIEKIQGGSFHSCLPIQIHRVCICFKNGNNKLKKANWIIKTSQEDDLSLEVNIYTQLLTDVYKYLNCRSNVRVRYLLNIPEMILHESSRNSSSSWVDTKIALVLEDLTKTKSCMRIKAIEVIAVGFAWGTSFGDDSLLESHPYLHRPQRICSEDINLIFDKYVEILNYAELRRNSSDILNCDVSKDMSSPCCGLCLGAPVPSDVLFRYDNSLNLLDEENNDTPNSPTSTVPICAAVNTCRRIHFGDVIREIATCFFTLPSPIVRAHYLTLMLQNYCQAFTLTSELLEVNTRKRINYSFQDFLGDFYKFVPHGILRAILMHMKRTRCSDIELLKSSSTETKDVDDSYCDDEESGPVESYHIPLSNSRIRFLVALLDPIKKSI